MKKKFFTKVLSLLFCTAMLSSMLLMNAISASAASVTPTADSFYANHGASYCRTFVLNPATGNFEPCLPVYPGAGGYCGTSVKDPCVGVPIMMAPNGDIIAADASGVSINGVERTADSFSAYIDEEFPSATYEEKCRMVMDWSCGRFAYVPAPVLGPAIMMTPNGDYITADGTTIAINGVVQTPESFSRYVDEKYPDVTEEERAKMVEDWSGFPYMPAEARKTSCDIGPAIWMGSDGTVYTADGSGVTTVILP